MVDVIQKGTFVGVDGSGREHKLSFAIDDSISDGSGSWELPEVNSMLVVGYWLAIERFKRGVTEPLQPLPYKTLVINSDEYYKIVDFLSDCCIVKQRDE